MYKSKNLNEEMYIQEYLRYEYPSYEEWNSVEVERATTGRKKQDGYLTLLV